MMPKFSRQDPLPSVRSRREFSIVVPTRIVGRSILRYLSLCEPAGKIGLRLRLGQDWQMAMSDSLLFDQGCKVHRVYQHTDVL